MPFSSTSSKALNPFWPMMATGNLYGSLLGSSAVGTLTVGANVLYGSPIYLPQAITLTVIGIEVTTGAVGNVRLGLYNDSAGRPGALKFDAGAVSTATPNGFKSIVISQALTSGLYWIAGVFDATPGVRALQTSTMLHWLGFSSGTDTTAHGSVQSAFTYAALPTPFTAGFTLTTTNTPRFLIGA